MYRYWLIGRPAVPGAIPTKNLDKVENFDTRQFVEATGRAVWGYVEYTEPLTAEDIADYELLEG